MKIAMVGQFPPHIGGVGVHINLLAHELVKRGHTVYV
ncbi:MAG: glycosyl transferase family 1, partial [Methanobrevibacter wolinii]